MTIDVDHQINATSRAVGSRTMEAGEARVVSVTRVYPTDVEDLWDACTNPERLPRWFLPVSGDLRVGGRYRLEGNAEGTVETCDPPHRFTATWEFGGDVSWIEVRVSDDGDGMARFTLEHIAEVDDDRWLQFGPGAVGVGWDLAMIGLTAHLEGGGTVDPAEVEEWLMSPDGKRFVSTSSDQWRDASVAAGTEPTEASEAAERTTAFYTGIDV